MASPPFPLTKQKPDRAGFNFGPSRSRPIFTLKPRMCVCVCRNDPPRSRNGENSQPDVRIGLWEASFPAMTRAAQKAAVVYWLILEGKTIYAQLFMQSFPFFIIIFISVLFCLYTGVNVFHANFWVAQAQLGHIFSFKKKNKQTNINLCVLKSFFFIMTMVHESALRTDESTAGHISDRYLVISEFMLCFFRGFRSYCCVCCTGSVCPCGFLRNEKLPSTRNHCS